MHVYEKPMIINSMQYASTIKDDMVRGEIVKNILSRCKPNCPDDPEALLRYDIEHHMSSDNGRVFKALLETKRCIPEGTRAHKLLDCYVGVNPLVNLSIEDYRCLVSFSGDAIARDRMQRVSSMGRLMKRYTAASLPRIVMHCMNSVTEDEETSSTEVAYHATAYTLATVKELQAADAYEEGSMINRMANIIDSDDITTVTKVSRRHIDASEGIEEVHSSMRDHHVDTTDEWMMDSQMPDVVTMPYRAISQYAHCMIK